MAYEKIIQQDLPIEKGFSDEANQRRFWKIEGFAQVPCGGTHVNSTGEVGLIQLKRENPGKGMRQVVIHCVESLWPYQNFCDPPSVRILCQ